MDIPTASQISRRAERRVSRALRWLDARFTRVSPILLGLLLAAVGLAKGGIAVFDSPLWSLSSWPEPVEAYPPLTYGFRLLGWLAQSESRNFYVLISLAFLVFGIPFMSWLICTAVGGDAGRFASLLLLGGPIVWVLWGGFGRTDVFVIVGGVLLATMGRLPQWAIPAAIIAILGNPEQAVMLSLSLLLLSITRTFKPWRMGALVSLTLSVTAFILLTLWSRSLGIPSRLDYFPPLVRQSVNWFFNSLPIELYAGFGIAIVLILWAILDQRMSQGFLVCVATVGLPVTMTALTLDQSRILVCTSIASVTAVTILYAPRVYKALRARVHYVLGACFLLVLALPAIEVTANIIRVPWTFFYPYLVAYVLRG